MELIDCQRQQNTELFLVEGKNAANALRRVRDRQSQAIFPLQGKVPNADQKTSEQLLANPVISALLLTLGGDPLSASFAIKKVRYSRVIILCDADADGVHARALLVRLFFVHFKDLVSSGGVFIVDAPLYGLYSDTLSGPEVAYSRTHRDRLLTMYKRGGVETIDTRYFKGLASLQPEMLARVCVDASTRTIRQLTLSDCAGSAI